MWIDFFGLSFKYHIYWTLAVLENSARLPRDCERCSTKNICKLHLFIALSYCLGWLYLLNIHKEAAVHSCCRMRDRAQPYITVMDFCTENLLACGSDCEDGGSAAVQLWDFDSPQSCLSFPASDSVSYTHLHFWFYQFCDLPTYIMCFTVHHFPESKSCFQHHNHR